LIPLLEWRYAAADKVGRCRRDYHIVVLGAGEKERLLGFLKRDISADNLCNLGGVGKSCLTGKASSIIDVRMHLLTSIKRNSSRMFGSKVMIQQLRIRTANRLKLM
jgi:hypothetical protein